MPRPYPDSAKRENFCGGWDFQKAQRNFTWEKHCGGLFELPVAARVRIRHGHGQPDRMADDVGWEAMTLNGELA
jgi:hypothetical protein